MQAMKLKRRPDGNGDYGYGNYGATGTGAGEASHENLHVLCSTIDKTATTLL
jgi:hypothetical protein